MKMFNLVTLILYGFQLGIGYGDLIGFNRLGNNVHSHRTFRNEMQVTNYEQQISRWIAQNNTGRLLAMTVNQMWQRASPTRERNTYKQRMIKRQLILANR